MSIVARVLVAVLAACSLPLTALAGAMPQAKVDFSADSVMEAEGMTINSRIYHSFNKDRVEMNMGGMNNVVINRMDKKLTWMLMPEQRMYTETDIQEGKKNSKDISDCRVDFKAMGADVVNGVKTTKNRISMTCPDNLSYTGHMWLTRESIMMKMDATAATADGNVSFKMELQNLKIARQDPKLFEVPAGYQKMNLGGMFGGMFGGSTGSPGASPARGGKVEKLVTGDEGGRSYTAKPRAKTKPRKGRSYTAQTRDEGRSYTSQPRDEGRSYTAEPRNNGRSYTAEPRGKGRSYTSQNRLDSIGEPVKKLRNFFGL